jgi:carboxyl-terminal processing protease
MIVPTLAWSSSRMKNPASLRMVALAVACLGVGVGVGRWMSLGTHIPAQSHATPGGVHDSYQFFDTLVDVRSQIIHNYVEPVDDQKLLSGAIQGMMAQLDPFSNYFSKDELARFDRAVHGQFSGVGAEFTQDPATGSFIVVSPIEDSPALKAGVFAGDRILKIDGESTEGMSLKDFESKVGGAPDTHLQLTVVHEGERAPVELIITRAVIQTLSVRGVRHITAGGWDFLIDPDHRIAYVRISNFMENTADELDKALLPLIQNQSAGSLKGIILDLRFNPGGLLQAGIDVSRRFLDSGLIVSTGRPDTSKRDFVAEANGENTYPRIPLVVLINKYSASASEIVAGALHDHQRAVLIGERSFGKGSVQTLLTVDNGDAALKLTTQYYYLPSGRNIMHRPGAATWGVEPDPAFTIPLSDEENRQVLLNRQASEIIRHVPAKASVAGDRTDLNDTAAGEASTAPATQPMEASDRQLQRALEILIAYQAFGAGKDFTANVVTTRPSASASVPSAPKTAPATTPATTVP